MARCKVGKNSHTLAHVLQFQLKHKNARNTNIKTRCIFSLEFFPAVIYTCVYIHFCVTCVIVNIYSTWLREQFCNLSLNMLYIELSVQ
jgi:hypothetical protein